MSTVCGLDLVVQVAGQVQGGVLSRLMPFGSWRLVNDGPCLGGQRFGRHPVHTGVLLVLGGGGHVVHLLPDVGPPDVRLELAQAARAEVHEVFGLVSGYGLLAAIFVLVGFGERAGRLGSAHSPRRSESVDTHRQVVREAPG